MASFYHFFINSGIQASISGLKKCPELLSGRYHLLLIMKFSIPFSIHLFLIITISACNPAKKSVLSVQEINIVPRSGWNANEPEPYKSHTLSRITIHHEGTRLEIADDAAKKIKNIQVWGMGPDRNWTDIPYHFLIAPDGTIYEGRNVLTVGETATEYDPTGHLLISCLGNLEVQEMPEQQLNSLIKLVAYCCKKYTLPLETLASHRDYSTQTSCPGKNLYQYLQNGYLKTGVKKLMNKNRK